MKLTDRIRNFFYAVSHADHLIEENTSLKITVVQKEKFIDKLETDSQTLLGENMDLNDQLSKSTTALKMWRGLFSRSLPDQFAPGQAKALYEDLAPTEDPDGFSLYYAAKGIWGNFPLEFYYADGYRGSGNINAANYYQAMMPYYVSWIKEAYPSFPEYEDAMYVNAMVRMGILGEERRLKISPDPLPKFTTEEIAVPGHAKELYEKYKVRLDPDGVKLFFCAEDILGEFNPDGWPFESQHGYFDVLDGNQQLKYLLVDNDHKLGSANRQIERWQVDGNYEKCVNFTIEPTPEYKAFENELYQKVCSKVGLVQSTELTAEQTQPCTATQEADMEKDYEPEI